MIRWGFLGAGWMATTGLAPAVHSAKNASLYAVASRDHARSLPLNPQKVHGSYEDLLADPDVDAVYINLANHQHGQWTIKALAAGKHVLCEKPLALDLAQAQMMASAAQQYDRLLVEAVWTRWHPRFVRIVNVVSGGGIGQLEEIDSSFCFTSEFKDNYRLDPMMGGGSLLDVGLYQAHTWSALNGGKPKLDIESVDRKVGTTGVDLTTHITGRLSSGVKVTALASFEKQEAQHLVITGSDATIQCQGNDAFTSWNKPSALHIGDHVEEFAAINPYAVMVENFGSRINGEPSWIPKIEESLYVMGLLDQIKAFK